LVAGVVVASPPIEAPLFRGRSRRRRGAPFSLNAPGGDRRLDERDVCGEVATMSEPMTFDELRENFEFLESWEDRYRYLIDLGKELPPMDDALKNDQTRVDGCLSQVWMLGRLQPDQTMTYLADSDAAIVRGLIAVLLVVYGQKTASAVAATDIDTLFDDLGLGQHISLNRRNGFYAMVQRIKGEATRLAAG